MIEVTNRDLVRFVWRHPANRGRRVRAMGRLAVWALFRRLGWRAVTFRWVAGRRMRWYPDSVSAGNAWLCGLLEWHDMRFVMDVVRPGDLFVDVGANVGVYTLLATLCPEVDVLAFEPGATARERLLENIELNGIADRVDVSAYALSDHAGTVRFTQGRDVLNRIVTDAESGSSPTEVVPTRRLDDLLGEADPRQAIVKIDAEGHDLQVLLGCRRLLERAHPPIIVEWSDPEPIRELLEPLGYRTYAYEPRNASLTETNWTTAGSNVIAIADRALIEGRLSR